MGEKIGQFAQLIKRFARELLLAQLWNFTLFLTEEWRYLRVQYPSRSRSSSVTNGCIVLPVWWVVFWVDFVGTCAWRIFFSELFCKINFIVMKWKLRSISQFTTEKGLKLVFTMFGAFSSWQYPTFFPVVESKIGFSSSELHVNISGPWWNSGCGGIFEIDFWQMNL